MSSLNFTEKIKNIVDCDLDPHEFLEIKFLMISVIGTLIGLFGLFGNFLTVIILTKPKMLSPNNMFLTALAIYDSCLLITAFFIYGMEYIIEYFQTINLYIAWLTYLKFAFSLSHISQTGSVYTTLFISVENFLSVRFPKTAKRFSTRKISAFTILGITCFAIFFNSTRFFELEVFENPNCVLDKINWQSYILVSSDLAKHPLYGQIFLLWVTNIFMIFLPFLTLLILNSIITCTIKKSIKLATEQKKTQIIELREKSRKSSMMLVVIVLIFLICNFWSFVLTLLEQIVGIKYLMTKYKEFYTFSREIINFLAIINSSINFVIYFVFDKDFRKEMIIFCSNVPFVTKSKIIFWSKKSKNKIFKNQTVVNEILKMTNFFRTLTVLNESRRQSTISNKKISIFTDSETNVDASEFQKFVESKMEITKVDDDSGNDSTNFDVIYFV